MLECIKLKQPLPKFKEKIKENTEPRVNTILSQLVYDAEQDTEK